MNTLKRVRAYRLLLPRYCIFSKMPWFLSGASWKMTSIWNFARRKVSTRIVHCKIFRSFCCYYPEIRTSNLPICMSYIKDKQSPYTLNKKGYFTEPSKRLRRCLKASKCVSMLKRMVFKIYEIFFKFRTAKKGFVMKIRNLKVQHYGFIRNQKVWYECIKVS
jgi:hypothetical protein